MSAPVHRLRRYGARLLRLPTTSARIAEALAAVEAGLDADRAARARADEEHGAATAAEAERSRREIAAVDRQVDVLRRELDDLRRSRDEVTAQVGRVLEAIHAATDDEAASRRLLRAARADPQYKSAFSSPNPLVSICIPTFRNWRLLEERSIPSALAQDHSNIEVVVVGDAAPPETAAAIERIGDERVRYENLTVRGPYPDDERLRWFVAGTGPLNRAMELARGTWLAVLNDDDALRPDHVSLLLDHARSNRVEVAYSKLIQHAPDGSEQVIGAFPPEHYKFGWQLALQHMSLRLFEFELVAAVYDEPGDWHRARRMLRAGVSFGQVDRVTCDYFPSLLWNDAT